ncbi:Protein kti12 [Thelohanellus kitauei]|uniref:Protein KTI12 homolog n=1 Tax=Thelohanellus kitauei TaxID=669202 RepID=A0A0C2N8W6_THEKT|nr:Protein kti12 [Thelohanellus kitauei]
MALVLLCGLPSSGKSTTANKIEDFFKNNTNLHTKVISENDKTLAQGDELFTLPHSEMLTRTYLKNSISQSNQFGLIIVDSASYIKSLRYEIYCLCKSQKKKLILVYMSADLEICLTLNEKRSPPKYQPDTIREVCSRFEFPNPDEIWDRNIVVIEHGQDLPFDKIKSLAFSCKIVKPNKSTVITPTIIKSVPGDNITQQIIEFINKNPSCGRVTIPDIIDVEFPKTNPTLHSLQTIRRRFLDLNRHTDFTTVSNYAKMFIDYLIHNIDPI